MEGQEIGWLLFGIFLFIAAMQDLRSKQVELWVFILFGILAFGLKVFLWLRSGTSICWWGHLKESCLGLGLLGLGKFCQGEIGAGDGLFFLISGWLLGFRENLLMFYGGVMFCGLYAMTTFVWYRICKKTKIGKVTIPFLPFVAVWGVLWISVQSLF